ncbi:kinesin-like protein KIN-7I isoform X2 [Typha angustifolia]|uniref:kinesin-like protein KIN-7I isoform X2 n=1 Tax=Typha angustifolia TaxID=59011 RepID=UPI003C2FBDF2
MERIYVTVRARPLSPEESKSSPWRICGNAINLANQSTKFEFDRIFGEDCKTAAVYQSRTKDIVASAVRGFNGTVFAYGQTNSGKTHTMRGSVVEPGIIPLAVHDLFESIQQDVDREFLVRMSYMEIYNEEINDLLAPEHRKLQIHESLERGIYVAGLKEEIVTCPEQVLAFMEFGESHRHIGETNMNIYSSRSHTIFRMIVESREKVEDGEMDDSCDAVRVSVLNLVDLAGSERAAKTGAEGMRLKEGSHINKSLMTLGTVIKKLSEGAESQGGHVPYRDSKLTRILQPALGGNANTAIICNITLAQVHTDETKSSLQFASRALRVTNCACVNEIVTDAALLKRQRKEIEELRAKLLSSHSEHWEEEILNLRNTLLQSELEKERIALELEEEKKAKAQSEKRLVEQERKIANLSSLVLCSERDEKPTCTKKNKRRVTWCPGPFSMKFPNEVLTPEETATVRDLTGRERDMSLPLPFEELIQENKVAMDLLNCYPGSLDDSGTKDIQHTSLPDAHALLHVTSRRKINVKAADSVFGSGMSAERQSKYDDQLLEYNSQKAECIGSEVSTSKLMESEGTPGGRCSISSLSQTSGTESCRLKSLTIRESEAILVIKQLQDQIKLLEMEKASIQNNLDNVLELATVQSISFGEKSEELRQEAIRSHEDARIAREQLCSVGSIGSYKEDLLANSSLNILLEVEGVVVQVDHSRYLVDTILRVVEELFQNFAILSQMLQELKSIACQEMVQFRSIISSYEKIQNFMRKKNDEIDVEKNILLNQALDHQNQIQELKSNFQNCEKAMADLTLQHDLEKDSILCQLLSLQKEVASLSSSSLSREKESLRKELEKTKVKLKEMESKLKNSLQEKIKLESEKVQAEREIKHLHSQKSGLERDIRKRDSVLDRRRESKSFDISKSKELNAAAEQTFQEDYQTLELHAFELEAEIASLQEALTSVVGEKEDMIARDQFLESELEAFANKMNIADSEIKSLKEELAVTKQRLVASESFCRSLEDSLDSLSREKEDMAMQLTDALLEVEAEKSMWSAKEKAFIEANDRVKISNNEIHRLSEDLSEVRHELESCREQCSVLEQRLILSTENAEREKEFSVVNTPELTHLRNELQENVVDTVEIEDVKSKTSLCQKVQKLQEQASTPVGEQYESLLQLKEMDTESDLLTSFKYLQSEFLLLTREKDDLLSKNEQLNLTVGDTIILKKQYDHMLLQAKSDSDELAKKIYSMEDKMHNEALKYNKEKTKLRMQLRSTQAKLDAFRGRYEEVMNEMNLMNRKFQEASTNLKKQLAAYGVEILSLKKQLATQE